MSDGNGHGNGNGHSNGNGHNNGNGDWDGLTGKQRAFIEEYFKDFNGTRAAERAGYMGDENVLSSVAYENLRKPKIAERIAARFQARCMTADEALARLGEQARADIGGYINAAGFVDLERLKADGKTHLIKKYKMNHLVSGKLVVEIETYDAQRALELIGKHHRLFVDRFEHEVNAGINIVLDE